MGKYLVCRMDAIRPHGSMHSSEHFPCIVETDPYGPTMTYDDIVKKAFAEVARVHGSYGGYVAYHDYIVVSLNSAKVVSFTKPVNYEVSIKEFDY